MMRISRIGRRRGDEGFSLVELMVVVFIIAILIAIAVPSFLGARRRAQDRQSQSNLRTALVSEKTYYADGQAYTDDSDLLRAIEANLQWGDETDERGVVVEDVAANDQGVVLRSRSRSGTRFCIADTTQDFDYGGEGYLITEAGTYYAKTTASDCTGVVWETTSAAWA